MVVDKSDYAGQGNKDRDKSISFLTLKLALTFPLLLIDLIIVCGAPSEVQNLVVCNRGQLL